MVCIIFIISPLIGRWVHKQTLQPPHFSIGFYTERTVEVINRVTDIRVQALMLSSHIFLGPTPFSSSPPFYWSSTDLHDPCPGFDAIQPHLSRAYAFLVFSSLLLFLETTPWRCSCVWRCVHTTVDSFYLFFELTAGLVNDLPCP